MKELLAFIRKEFLHIFRDRRTILIVLVMPVIQIVLFGYAVSTEIHGARVDIVGDITDPSVREIAARIDNNEYLDVGKVLASESEIDGRFRRGKADAAVCFCEDFDSKYGKGLATVKIIGDGSDPNTAQMISNYVKGVLQSVARDSSDGEDTGTEPVIQLMYNPSMKSSYNFVPGVMGLILTLICSMMTAVSIVREKETGTMELLLVSPVRPVMIIISKAVPYLVLSVLNFTSILLLSHYVMDVPVNGSLLLLCLAAFVYVLASLALGLLISVVAPTQRVALLISGMGLMMPTMILSGIIFPCESMPAALQAVSHVIPAKWFIIMAKKIMIQGAPMGSIVKELTILSSMAVFLLAVSISGFRTRLKQ